MVGVVVPVVLLALLPAWVASSGEGNIKLLEDEVAVALKSCTYPEDTAVSKEPANKERQRRSDDYDGSPRIDNNMKEGNRYSHERRNSNDSGDQIMVMNATDYDYEGYGTGNMGEKLLTSAPRPAYNNVNNNNNTSRTRRSESLLNKPDSDQVK